MGRDTVVILGIPIDNLTLEEAVNRIFTLIDAYRSDGVPRQVATVNVDFIVNTLTWKPEGVRHPELLDILRRADMVTADGMPLVWLSRLLGCPLKERVTGADMVPALAAEAARRGKSLFFLGGRNGIGQQAATLLQQRNPGMIIAGVSSPFVSTEGEQLTDFELEDAAIIEEINAARPDILLIAFGNPKQELWFARNAPRLRVPLSIGIGGTYEFIVGTVSRAPIWVQKTGMEWIYRILMEPRRLWKRYAIGLAKFVLHAWPLIRLHRADRKRIALQPQASRPTASTPRRIEQSCWVVTLPPRLDALAVKSLEPDIEHVHRSDDNLILDFIQVDLVDASGLGFLVRLWRQNLKTAGKVYLVSFNAHVLEFLRFNRVADLFKERLFNNQETALSHIRAESKQSVSLPPYTVSFLPNGTGILALCGRLDAAAVKNFPFDQILAQLSEYNCILDLRELDFADSSGLVAFHRIQRQVTKGGRSCILCAPREPVLQLLRLTRLDRLFTITDEQAILAGRSAT